MSLIPLPETQRQALEKVYGDLNTVTELRLSPQRCADLQWLVHCPNLTQLHLGQITDLCHPEGDDTFPFLPQLECLYLFDCEGEQLPHTIRSLGQLNELLILDSQLKAVGDLSQMGQLTELYIGIHVYNSLGSCPNLDGALMLPQLKVLTIQPPLDQNTAPAALPLFAASVDIQIECNDNLRRSKDLTKQLKVLRQSSLSNDDKKRYTHILLGMNFTRELPEMDGRFYLTFLEGKYQPFKEQALAWLRQQSAGNLSTQPLGDGAVLYICGKIGIKANELKDKLTPLGITISKKLTEQVSHIVLGNNPKDTHLFSDQDPRLIDETGLQQSLQSQAPQFLQQAMNEQPEQGQVMVDNVLSMLGSPDNAAHHVALSLIEQGGVTPQMHLPLFFVLKTTKDAGIRKSIKSLLAGMGEERFQMAVQDRTLLHELYNKNTEMSEYDGEGLFYQRLKGLEKKWGKGLCQDVALRHWQHHGEGLLYILFDKEESDCRDQAINACIEQQEDGRYCLNWSRACGFNNGLNWADSSQETPEQRTKRLMNIHRSPSLYLSRNLSELKKKNTRLPAPERLSDPVQVINARNCLLKTLPVDIEQYPHITHLNLSRNRLEELPAKLTALQALTHLDLSFNHFDAFPQVLINLPSLQWIDLRRARQPDYHTGYDPMSYRPIEIPEAFRKANPDCQILTEDNAPIIGE